ncbi:hypothetical protein CFIO01_02477 [Colletotrichum fioriniae PJ7]|uniref:Uncharacterized protein n=1 Tax=Colletotrichum fioriniae PJ7 TaxID=1445577 RepID=A0A010Q1K0_9PEZI|nr:hypothetical protein CFIO01_02477 [Colletotrichum fioriniae PJ7]
MTRNLANPTITSPEFLVCRMPSGLQTDDSDTHATPPAYHMRARAPGSDGCHFLSYTHQHQPTTYTINNPSTSPYTQNPITKPTTPTTMAAFTLLFTPATTVYGRSGYNKDGDDEEKNDRGRSGYNKDGDDDDEGQNKGRSGYNKDGDDEEDK